MGFQIDTLYMQNFKLFSSANLHFEKNRLVMLDGANGYGKTSTFDALEYLFTGNIQRVSNNGVSKKNILFKTDCLRKTPCQDEKITLVRGTFVNEKKERLEVTREFLPGEGVEKNPAKITEHTFTTIKLDEQIICHGENVENANNILKNYWGEIFQKYYHNFFYISQEDRLNFLSQQEDKRAEAMEGLLGLQQEREMLDKLKSAVSQLGKWKKQYADDLSKKTEEIIKYKKDIEEFKKKFNCTLEYKDLFAEQPHVNQLWNQKHPQIESQQKLLELQEQILAVGYFTRDFVLYQKDAKYQWLEKQLIQPNNIRKYLYLARHRQSLTELFDELNLYAEINEILCQARIENNQYDMLKFNFEKLSKLLKINTDMEQIKSIIKEVNEIRKNVSKEDAARESITNLQKEIQKRWQESLDQGYRGLDDRHCPLCGNPYADGQALLDALLDYREVIERGKKDSQRLIEHKIAELEQIYSTDFQTIIADYLQENAIFASPICKDIKSTWRTVLNDYKQFQDIVDELNVSLDINIENYEILYSDDTIKNIAVALQMKFEKLSDIYYEKKNKYQYEKVFSLVFENQAKRVSVLTEEDIAQKRQYVEQEYYGGRQKELDKIEQEQKALDDMVKKITAIYSRTKKLQDNMKVKFDIYRAKLVGHLQVPFYLYSGRIMQNYPGGLGLMLRMATDKNVRFEAERRPGHDVLYTLSSGQLSAAAIALTMTLNRVYGQNNIKCMLIDDPVQTMDELSIVSFMEVLRADFNEYQIIMSTHEEDFSDYMRYKYDKYGLENTSISMQSL